MLNDALTVLVSGCYNHPIMRLAYKRSEAVSSYTFLQQDVHQIMGVSCGAANGYGRAYGCGFKSHRKEMKLFVGVASLIR